MESKQTFDQVLSGASKTRQLMYCSCLFWISISLGYSLTSAGVLIKELATGSEGFNLTSEDLSWLASVSVLAAFPILSVGGLVSNQIGRKKGALLVCPFFVLGYLLNYFSTPEVNLLLLGQSVMGITFGLQHSSLLSYFTEVTSPQNRTAVHAFSGVWFCLGVLLPVILAASGVYWRTIMLMGTICPCVGLVFILFIPESPAWCVIKGKLKEGRAALVKLRGPDYPVDDELEYLKRSYAFVKKDGGRLRAVMSRLGEPDVWKPFVILMISMALMSFSAVWAIDRYILIVFQTAGTQLGPYEAAIPVQAVKIFGQLVGTFLLVQYPRRPIYIASAVLTSIGLAGLGLSTMLQLGGSQGEAGGFNSSPNTTEGSLQSHTTDLTESVSDEAGLSVLSYLPVISGCIVTFSASFGIIPIPWAYGNELYPIDIRSEMSGFSASANSVFLFLQIKLFPNLTSSLGTGETFLLFSGVTFISVLWGVFGLPETRGKTLHEITEMFYSKSELRKKNEEKEKEEEERTKLNKP